MRWSSARVAIVSALMLFACGTNDSGANSDGTCESPSSCSASPLAIQSFVIDRSVTAGKSASGLAVFSGGPGVVDHGVGAIQSGVAFDTGPIDTDTEYTLIVSNASGERVSAAQRVSVGVAPRIVSFQADASRVSKGATSFVTGTFEGGVGVIDNGIGAVTSGQRVSVGPLKSAVTLTLSVTNALGDAATATVQIDTKRELFVSNAGVPSVAVYDEDVNDDNAPPKRVIAGAQTTFVNDLGLYVADDELYVANFSRGSVNVFDASASGDVAPKRTIVGDATMLGSPVGIFVTGGEVFVGDDTGAVKVWNSSDAGNVAPRRVVTGDRTGFSKTTGIWIDGNELYVGDYSTAKISVFPASASGNVPPLRTFDFPGGGSVVGVYVTGSELVATNGYRNGVATFDKASTALLRSIAYARPSVEYMALCIVRGADLLCSQYFDDSLVTFPTGADDNALPSRTIRGFSKPLGMFVY